jgi:mono/diheme cytochrome c family protein
MTCHDHSAGWVLGFHTAQLNRESHYPGGSSNQLTALHEAGYFSNPTAPEPNLLPALAKADDKEVSLEFRVRSYLDANCSQCHNPNGLAQGELDARYETPTEFSNLIRGMLNSPELGDDVLMIQPGAPEHSMLLSRIQTRGAGQMPPMGSNELDPSAIELITEWIETGLADYKTYAEWRVTEFGTENADLSEPNEDADQDGASNLLEYLTHTDPQVAGDAWKISLVLDSGLLKLQIPRLRNRSFQIQYTDDLYALEGPEWKPLNHPVNRPFFSSEDLLENLTLDLDSSPGRIYRALLVAP